MDPNGIVVVFWSLAALLHIGLALPPALRERSWKRFCSAVALSFFGVVLPVFIFSASALLPGPEWKGASRHGWLDFFHIGKLALLPVVLWASAALYAIDIYRTHNRTRPWIVLGILMGAMTSVICLGIGGIIQTYIWETPRVYSWLLVPLYVSVWYTIRARQLLKAAGTSLTTITTTLLGTTPFWLAALLWSRKEFMALPDKPPPGCFVVTAATRGHAAVVGPRLCVTHRGAAREATQQLLTLWRLEDYWTHRAPRSHARFRRVYNIIGPIAASRITTSFRADLAYLAIKPVELLARAILKEE